MWGADADVGRASVKPFSGGRIHIVMKKKKEYPDGPHETVAMRGMVLVYEPGRRLFHTSHWDAPVDYNAPGMDPIDELIAADIEADGGGAVLRYTHQGKPDDGRSADITSGASRRRSTSWSGAWRAPPEPGERRRGSIRGWRSPFPHGRHVLE